MRVSVLITIPVFLLLPHCLMAQMDSATISAIDATIKDINSLINNEDRQVSRLIEEGRITLEETKTSWIGHNHFAFDATTQKITGGFAKYFYHNSKADTVYKIQYHHNLQKNFYLTFYYKDNILIYSILNYQENSIGQIFL
jgi:hypothetical protein